MFEVRKALIIKWVECPDSIREVVKGYEYFGNSRYLEVISEFDPEMSRVNTWKESLTQDRLEGYFKQQYEDGICGADNLEDFVDEYGLDIEVWLLTLVEDGGLDLTGVQKILFEIDW